MSGEVIVATFALLVSIAAFAASARALHADASLHVTNSLNELLRTALTCDQTLDALYAVFPQYGASETYAIKRKRVAIHHILNMIQYAYLARERWVMEDVEANRILTRFLREILLQVEGREAIEKGNYDDRFVEWAQRFRP